MDNYPPEPEGRGVHLLSQLLRHTLLRLSWALEGGLLGGSWVVISGAISRVTILITHIRGLITLLITTHEPPSKAPVFVVGEVWGF